MCISDEGSLDVQMLLKEVKNAFGIQSQGCSYFIQKSDQDWNLIFLLNVNSRL